MARQARLVLAGHLHHVLQRGNNRQSVFLDDLDRGAYLDALREATRLHGVAVHGYVLMPNHVHLLVTPSSAQALARAMQTLGRRYVAAFNRRHGRSGTLWEGRFRTTLIEAPLFYAATLQYIEQHPQRAGLVDFAGEFPWCSAAHHLGQRRDALISEHAAHWALGNTPFERELAWRQALAQAQPPELLAQLRRHVHGGWPLLSPNLARNLAQQLERPMAARPAGRPRRDSVTI